MTNAGFGYAVSTPKASMLPGLEMPESPLKETILRDANQVFSRLAAFDGPELIDLVNLLRGSLRNYSPFREEPVDCVLWVPNESVEANDYNPNTVAPPEMKLLEHSILEDGYTQPIVAWKNEEAYTVVDGFHRHRVGKECKKVNRRVHGYLPLAVINSDRSDRNDRIAATIRHNRARGKHKVEAMSDIVIELKRRNWTDEKIGKELGMDPDEVLRLTQITGLAEMFKDREFSEAWVAETINEDDDLRDEVEE